MAEKIERETSAKQNSVEVGSYRGWRGILFASGWSLLAGLVASLMAVVTMGMAFFVLGIPTPVELFSDFFLKHINVDVFIRLLGTYGKMKPLAYALLSMIGIGTVIGLPYALLVRVKLPAEGYRPGRREWLVAGSISLAMTLVAVILFWDELRQNLYGLTVMWSRVATIVGLVCIFGVYGIVLCLAYRVLVPKVRVRNGREGVKSARRQLFARAGVVAVGIGAGAGTYGLVQKFLQDFTYYDGFKVRASDGFTPPITTNDQHYVVTQNTIDPTPNTNLWRLEIGGLINKSGSFTYEEVLKLPSISRAVTLECIANAIGNVLISNAIWQGVPLKDLLEMQGGALAEATHVAFHSVDGYTVSLPLKEVLEADAMLAYRMNGVPLPVRHGYPMRVLIPGRYGEEQPKWVTRIELTSQFVNGLYSSQGWYNGPLHTISRIDRPKNGVRVSVGTTVEIGGIAFAGDRGIRRVEFSTDGGKSWSDAKLEAEISPDAWRLWSFDWKPVKPGESTLVARATDGTGEVQTDKVQITVPNGATGYHKIKVRVV